MLVYLAFVQVSVRTKVSNMQSYLSSTAIQHVVLQCGTVDLSFILKSGFKIGR